MRLPGPAAGRRGNATGRRWHRRAVAGALVLAAGSLAAAPALAAGDVQRGRAILVDRRVGLCLLCHSGPFPDVPQQGDLAPSLAGAGSRWSLAQLRSRIEDPSRFVAGSFMPAFGDHPGRWREATPWAGRPILSPQQIEDVSAFLATLRD